MCDLSGAFAPEIANDKSRANPVMEPKLKSMKGFIRCYRVSIDGERLIAVWLGAQLPGCGFGAGLTALAGTQFPLKEGSLHVVPSDSVMHSMITRSFPSARAETICNGAERVYPSSVFS